jgi:hypothetical protein
LRFRKEDYAPLEPSGDWFSVSTGGLEWNRLGADILDRVDQSAYTIQGITPMTRLWGTGLLEAMLVLALLGALLCAVLHVASLCGYTVVRGDIHLLVAVVMFLTFSAGMFAHYQMGNASGNGNEIHMSYVRMARWLTLLERAAFLIAFAYAVVATALLWPWPRTRIHGSGDMSLADARAVWPFQLAFYVASAALLQSARRLASQRLATR